MRGLIDLIGKENPLDVNARALRDFARGEDSAAVGAMHVTCSDECERECVESFQQWFAEDLLPGLKYSLKSPFRTANLGARYEVGSAALAENHFTANLDDNAARDKSETQLLLVKLNSHVAVTREGNEVCYGTKNRYNEASHFCGALHAALSGGRLPAVDEISQLLRSGELDRIALLQDASVVEPRYRSLLAAVANARLQAKSAIADIEGAKHHPHSLVVVVPCVTINRHDRDTELVVGIYTADFRGGKSEVLYSGLGDNPRNYDVALRHEFVRIEDATRRDDHVSEVKEPAAPARTSTAPVTAPSVKTSRESQAAAKLSSSSSLSMGMNLEAGSDLEFSSMSQPISSLPEPTALGEPAQRQAVSRLKSPEVKTASQRDEGSVPGYVEVKAITDNADDISAIDTPAIEAESREIVDRAKDVTALKTAAIQTSGVEIEDRAPDVTAIETQKIIHTDKPMPVTPAAPLDDISAATVESAPLRKGHVVQPSQTPPSHPPTGSDDADMVIEAELIPVDDDPDAIIIIDENYRIRR